MTEDEPRWSPEGLYLALETSGPVGSVALGRGGRVLADAVISESGQQSSRLIPSIAGVLERAGLGTAALSGIVIGAGPGSFTGVRIAAATAKGLAHALDLPVWAFSSLASAALSGTAPAGGSSRVRYVLFDARGDRVYAACYRLDVSGPEPLVPAHATVIGDLLSGSLPYGVQFAGDGALRHRAHIEDAGHAVLSPPAGTATAESLLRILALRPAAAPVAHFARWEPHYLKASSAERERERRGTAL